MQCFICLEEIDLRTDYVVRLKGFSRRKAKEPAHKACGTRMWYVQRIVDSTDWGERNWDYQPERKNRRYED